MEKGWTEVYTTSLEHQASITKGLLENANTDAAFMNHKGSTHQLFGEFTILVADRNKAQAVEILKTLKP